MMKRYIMTLMTIAIIFCVLAAFTGCGKNSSNGEEDGIFVADSEEYMILDEGVRDNNSEKAKEGSSNTNAKTSSAKDKTETTTSPAAETTSPAKATSSPSPSGNTSSGTIENELPLIPAGDTGNSSKSKSKSSKKNSSHLTEEEGTEIVLE